MRLLRADISSEESLTVDRLVETWDRRKPAPTPQTTGFRRTLVLSLAAVAAAAVFGILLWNSNLRSSEPRSGEDVVLLLMAQTRSFEFRLDQQPYLPIVRTRGGNDPGVDYDLIAGEMTRLGADSYAMGRFYLLQKNFDRAIGFLEEAENQPAASAAVHNDLGVAYMERGGDIDLRKAAEEFRHALALDEAFAPAAFNLAIFHERTGGLSQAEMQWRRYLQLDSDSGWAGEVRSKLETMSR
jgi:tetratricopeptide (TPR) repeat protein